MILRPYERCTLTIRAFSFGDAEKTRDTILKDDTIIGTRGDEISICSHPEEDGTLTYYVMIITGNIRGMAEDLTDTGWLS